VKAIAFEQLRGATVATAKEKLKIRTQKSWRRLAYYR